MTGPAPTIYTVAERAGVSVATVSRVLQGHRATSAAARERVLAAVEELGYSPLRRSIKRPQTLGVVVPNLSERTWTELLLGLQTQTTTAEARMVLSCDGLGETAEIDEAINGFATHTDGLVLCESTASDQLAAELAGRQPVVLVGRDPLAGCDVLQVDQAAVVAELVAGLASLGKQRVVFIGDPDASQALALRHTALVELLDQHDMACQTLAVQVDETGADQGLQAVLDGDFDVAVCATDEVALRLMHLLVWRQVRVPAELAVVGWGGLAAADYVVPRLTTVHEPARELGALAAARLRTRLGGGAAAAPQVLTPYLSWRESTGRPGSN